ncbi:hypothetical protein [Pseudoalteromonas lipolytica]|uniref:Membrane protein triplicated sequence n=1 Tax=Pseudoalteromonas lipolytica TaxID=570156 RepID=A0ABY1GES1_9GAMM|nr:hypothetical protein [Pseudoalteromonas lipolytica]SFT59393.1 hypothetical protein SAMN04487854_105163 [Pseudoalteromonas lipolytica]
MYISDVVGSLIGAFIEWGFLMAFLFNLVTHINKPDKRLVVLSLIMMLSYFLSGVLNLSSNIYLNWFYFDVITIAAIFIWIYCGRADSFCAIYYVVVGLFLNSLLMLSIFVDIVLVENRTPWILWSIYSFGVNIIDLMMIVALLTNKDFFKFAAVAKRFSSKATRRLPSA